ncbi:MAG: transcriptional repressor [Peptostreptococcaceae bacterium]|nr:transcriptional repressor [Peptostreptococcaceae bacterium]
MAVQKRNTIQRKLVLDAVLSLHNHPTAEDIYQKIVETHKTISRGTVYRNLNLLVEDGYISKVSIYDGADRFDYKLHRHNHIKCSQCQQIFDAPASSDSALEEIIRLNKQLAETSDFEILGYEIVFSGICPDCRAKEKKN